MKAIVKVIFTYQVIFLLLLSNNALNAQNWDWVEHISGANNIEVTCIVQSNNKIYSSGDFQGTATFLTAPGPENNLVTNLDGGFVLCHNLEGELIWANAIETTVDVQIKGIALDASENIYITGSYNGNSATFYSQNNEDNILLGESQNHDAFIAKYDNNGNLLWANTIVQSTGLNRGFGIKVDDIGNIYIGGFWRGGNLIFPLSSISIPYNSSTNWGNGFVAKFNSNFEPLWVSTIVGGSIDGGVARVNGGISLSQDNGIYASGPFQKTVYFDKTYYADGTEIVHPETTYTAGTTAAQDVIAFKLNSDGSFGWARHLANFNQVANSGNSISSNKENGDVYFVGNFAQTITIDNAPEHDPILLSSNGGEDNFIVKYNYTGLLEWAYSFGGLSNDGINDVSYSSDLITASGYFSGSMYLGSSITTLDTLTSAGGTDAFLINLSKEGQYLSSTSLKGMLNENMICVDNDNLGNSTVGGYFSSPNLKIGEITLTNGGNLDGFLAKHINIHILPTISETTCSNSQDGAISLEVSGGGQEPYTYEFSVVNGVIINAGTYTGPLNFTNLESGVYRFMVSDNLNRSVTKFYHIVAPAPIVIDGVVTDVTGCYANENGQIVLTVTGGVGDYTFLWDTPNGYGLVPNAQNQSSLTAGTYVVTVTDANGCMASESFEISQPDKINFEGSIVINNTNTDPLNPNGCIDLIVNNGVEPYSFTWKGPNGFTSLAQNLIGIRGGTYILKLQDTNGCIANASFNLGDENLFNAWITQTINPKCKGGFDGSATVDFENVTGGVTIVWSNGQTDVLTATNLSAGEYSIKLTDDMGTPSDTGDDIEITLMPVLVGEPDFALNVTSIVKKTNCPADNDGSIQLTVNGWSQPYQYDWSTSDGSGLTNGIKDQFELTIGSYSYTVTDKYGCAVGSAVNVSSNYSAPSFSFNVSPSNIICEGTEVVFSASEGFLYQFYINDLPQGDFSTTNTLTIIEPIDGMRVRAVGMNTAGCSGESEEIVLTVTPNVGIPTFTSGASSLCFGATETYIATADNAESIVYSIENGTAVVDPSTGEVTNINADFTIRATAYGYNGCGEEHTELAVTVNPIPEPTISTIDNLAICSGDDISIEFMSDILNADGYQWIKNTEVITGANESSYTATEIGIYSLEVTENGCSGISNSLEIIQIELPVPTISTADPLEWTEGESISVNFTVDILDADAYQWLLNGNPITEANANSYLASEAGIYSAEVTQLGCMGVSNTLEIAVVPTETYVVTFTVTNNSANAIEGAEVSVSGYDPIVTDASGEATISLPNGTYTFEVSANDYHLYSNGFEVNNADAPVAVQLIGVGINPNQLLSVSTYPNPFKNYIYITNVELVKRVVVSNITGQVVLDTTPDGTNKVNAQGIKSGIYIVRLIGYDGKTAIYKMIKE